jgi:hypothetical protein
MPGRKQLAVVPPWLHAGVGSWLAGWLACPYPTHLARQIFFFRCWRFLSFLRALPNQCVAARNELFGIGRLWGEGSIGMVLFFFLLPQREINILAVSLSPCCAVLKPFLFLISHTHTHTSISITKKLDKESPPKLVIVTTTHLS